MTTLKLLKARALEPASWRKVLKLLGKTKADDEEISFIWLSNNLGLGDACWCLRAVREEDEASRDRLARLFACDCVERVASPYPKLSEAVEVARRFAEGDATEDGLGDAWVAARREADGEPYYSARVRVLNVARLGIGLSVGMVAYSASRFVRPSRPQGADESLDEWLKEGWDAEREEQAKIFKKYFDDENEK